MKECYDTNDKCYQITITKEQFQLIYRALKIMISTGNGQMLDFAKWLANGDLITIPSERELCGWNRYAAEDEDGIEQWKPMEDKRNRVAFRDGVFELGWLSNVANSTDFVRCNSVGTPNTCEASSYLGVRPVFIIDSNMEERDD